MIRIPLLLMGYLFGCLQTSFVYGKKQGLDIREHGSGNAGTTNALRVMGRKAGIIVFLGDLGKMLLALLFAGWLSSFWGEEYWLLSQLYTAAGVVLGHDFPYYMDFRGGKGVASTGGMMLLLDWRMALYSFISFLGVTLLSKRVSLGSILMLLGNLVLFPWLLFSHKLSSGIMSKWEALLIFAAIVLLSLIRHHENIKRLIKGEEKPISF